jgi:hypothetical protein
MLLLTLHIVFNEFSGITVELFGNALTYRMPFGNGRITLDHCAPIKRLPIFYHAEQAW